MARKFTSSSRVTRCPKIAKTHGTTVKAIESENGLSTTQIKVGQKLKIPAKAEAAPAPGAGSGTGARARTAAGNEHGARTG